MKNLLAGTRALVTGFGTIVRSPRMLLLGAVPALITSVVLLGLLVALVYFAGDIVTWLTPFAEGWSEGVREAIRVLAAIALVGAAAVAGSLSFIALTLLIGGPFYEAIAERTERQLGLDTHDDGAGTLRSVGRGVRDSLKLVVVAALGAVVLFAIGFVPVVGQATAVVLAALFGAWVISLEMIGLVFQRRGLRLGDRHRALRRNKAAVLGFGVPTYVLCLVPVVQLIAIPSAVVGGTLLAHRFLGPGTDQRT